MTSQCTKKNDIGMPLLASIGVSPLERIKSFHFLAEYHDDWEKARNIEAVAHAISETRAMYVDTIQRLAFNLHSNPTLRGRDADLVLLTDAQMSKGTIIEDIEREIKESRVRFDQIVQEKYELVNRASCRTALRCRRCGSGDVQCEQKQTRGADEAMTVFVTCSQCNNRWTMR